MDLLQIFIGIWHLIKFDFENFILIYNSLPTDYTWVVFLLLCFITILIFLKIFGEVGLYVYTVIAIIVGILSLEVRSKTSRVCGLTPYVTKDFQNP